MGYPLYGQDLDPSHTTLEAGLGWAVSFDKGDFRGRRPLERQRDQGLPSRLHGLATADRRHIPRAHQTVLRDGEAVGEITSGTFSPIRGTGIGLAYLSPGDGFDVGDELEVDIRGRRAPATGRLDAVRRALAEVARPYVGVASSSPRMSGGSRAAIMSGTEAPANVVASRIRRSCCGARRESGTTATTT